MNGITDSSAFLVIWIGFTGLMIVVVGLIFLWGIRTRQFADQDRARYLPLDSGVPEEQRGGEKQGAGRRREA